MKKNDTITAISLLAKAEELDNMAILMKNRAQLLKERAGKLLSGQQKKEQETSE